MNTSPFGPDLQSARGRIPTGLLSFSKTDGVHQKQMRADILFWFSLQFATRLKLAQLREILTDICILTLKLLKMCNYPNFLLVVKTNW